MKIRDGFVSNSSSSSFTCDVCGRVESGYDANLRDFEMFECKNGHCMCQEHAVRELTEEEMDELYEVNIEACPICQLKVITDYDLIGYILARNSLTKKELHEEIENEFKDFKSFRTFINEYLKGVKVKTE
jgi:hypothetical protein